MNGNIYVIENLENGKKYVGSTTRLTKRKRNHFNKLKKGTHSNSYLQRSFNKYGREAFSFTVVLSCPASDVIKYEQYYLDKYELYDRSKGYNIQEKADRSEHSDETIQKLKNQMRGEQNPFYGKSHDVGSIKKMSDNSVNKKLSVEEVLEIKRSMDNLERSFEEISNDFDVSRSIITMINLGKVWSWLGDYEYPIREKSQLVKGERTANNKLSKDQVLEIKNLLNDSDLTKKEIVEKFCIGYSQLCRINRGEFWEFVGNFDYPIRENQKSSDLTKDDVLEIKDLLSDTDMSQRDISDGYPVSYSTISNINSGKTHKELGDYSHPIR